jgi:excisionase family DNA binding protein
MTLLYPPPYQDIEVLSEHLSVTRRTIDTWVKVGKLPAPRVQGGKRLWKWTDVQRYLDGDTGLVPSSPDQLAARITEATRNAIASRSR